MNPSEEGPELPEGAFDKLRRIAASIGRSEERTVLLGKYRLRREIASGAMGVVYEAEDTELRRRVAVKILRDVPGMSDVVRLRFRREAQSAAMLSHPNVVRLYDAGEDDGQVYLVMELVEGRPLSEILGGRKHEVRPMLHLLERVARGLAAAHEAGIVHRDVKPANILVTEAGEPKVGDFGLAHWMDAEAPLTKSGSPLGTPMYMAPEQVQGGTGRIRPATDVYALGGILYEILTGRPPHTGDSTMEIYGRIVHDDPPPPRRLSSRVSHEVQTICLKALEKDPARRYPTAKEFADDLRRYLEGESILARPPGMVSLGVKWVRRHRMAGLAAAMAILALAAVGAVVAANAAERRRSIERLVGKGGAVLGEYRRLQGEIADLEGRAERLEAETDPAAGEEEKEPLWKAREAIRAKEREATERAGELVAAFTTALVLDPRHPVARASLAAYHLAEFERAERRGDRRGMDLSARLAEVYDDGSLAAALRCEGTLALDSRPSGAEAELYRYEEGLDQRLMAQPLRSLGVCPVASTPVPAGSYLVLLRKEGHRDVRYPVRIGRGTEHAGLVNLYTEGEIGPGFVYVPAGPFLLGGDPEALHPVSGRPDAETGDYFISRFEVTVGEYIEFLNHVISEEGAPAAQRRTVRRAPGEHLWRIPENSARFAGVRNWEDDWPVVGVSWEDAEAWCRWRTEKARSEGERVSFRLPTGAEWEKAARGADGRAFPWGDRFDFSFAKSGHPRSEGGNQLSPVGLFGKDESPYGVRDMAGGAAEYCSDWFHEPSRMKAVRGGSWLVGNPVLFRAATRTNLAADGVTLHNGFRIVKVPDP